MIDPGNPSLDSLFHCNEPIFFVFSDQLDLARGPLHEPMDCKSRTEIAANQEIEIDLFSGIKPNLILIARGTFGL
ncbi:hypothetical protein MRB53_011039 [Persea americana]|uniref:Uncharacterized protein n=1 Tax=Persea americana TaxID=3435 RepID=A0ACC2LTN9_PERAE|nr:hypothetical protein MRB53_011039 [Persea americana]